jgi:hypothetical protein
LVIKSSNKKIISHPLFFQIGGGRLGCELSLSVEQTHQLNPTH